MAMQRVKCREHDGWFRRVVKPGRPPVRCSQETPCDKVSPNLNKHYETERPEKSTFADARPTRKQLAAGREAFAKRERVSQLAKRTGLREAQIVIKPAEAAAEPRSPRNRSVPSAQACKAELEALGWTAKGRGWFEEPDEAEFPGAEMAEVTAVRGSESLVITWNDGKVSRQDYDLWHGRRSLNGAPASKLKFNPDEMTDGELVRAISGMKVTWWNSLGKSEESYAVGDRISIEHFYADNGDEDTGRRIVKFIDRNGGGYRHFHVDALLKVG